MIPNIIYIIYTVTYIFKVVLCGTMWLVFKVVKCSDGNTEPGHVLRYRISDGRMTPGPRNKPADQDLIDLNKTNSDWMRIIRDRNLTVGPLR